MSQMISNIPSEFVKRWESGLMELSAVESLMRFALTHDITFVQNQHNLHYTAIVQPKKESK